MKTSEQIDKLAGALAKAQASIKAPPKNRVAKVQTKTGGEYSYKYADLSDIIDAIKGPLAENGLAITAGTESNGHLSLHSRLIHSSGQWIEATYPLPEVTRAQEMGSAITYGRRYLVCALLGIVAEDDDDGQAAQNAPAGGRQKPKAEKPAPQEDKKPEPHKPAQPVTIWKGTVTKVDGAGNGKWKLVGGDGTELFTAVPEHAEVGRTAVTQKTPLKAVYVIQATGHKRITSVEPDLDGGAK